MLSGKKYAPLLCFAITAALFSIGVIGTEITKIDIRFALMVQDMARHGAGLFPTVNAVEYCDYPSGWIACSWLTTFAGTKVTLWLLSLPTILLGAYTMMMTYLTGERIAEKIGLVAVMLLLITPTFLQLFAGFGLDVPVMAAGITMLYVLQRGCCGSVNWGIFAILLILCFAVRGPMGIVLLGAGIGGYLLAGREWKKVIYLGFAGAFASALCGILWYRAVHAQGGRELWDWFVQCQIGSRMGDGEYGTYFIDGMLSFAPVTLLAFGVFLLPRAKILSRPVAGWLGYVFLPILILSIPACKHLRYLALALPGFALLASYAWNQNVFSRFKYRRLSRVPELFKYLATPLVLGAIGVLAVVGCFVVAPSRLPWWHFVCAAVLVIGCRYLKGELKRFSPAIVIGVFLIVALNPFLACLENSEVFVSQVESERTGAVYLYEMGPDHDDLKYVLWVAPEKRGQVRYLFEKAQKEEGLYGRMYPSETLSERMGDITSGDVLILRDRKSELESLGAEARKHGMEISTVNSGSLGHREFVAVRLIQAGAKE